MTPIRRRRRRARTQRTVTTDGSTNISQTGATLSGSYSSLTGLVVEAGFDLFAGLLDYLEAAVESAKPGWSDFKNF